MLLRAVIAVGGITFIVTGLGILMNPSCRSVVWGTEGSARAGNFTATCRDAVVSGAMPQGVAGSIALLFGIILVIGAILPMARAKFGSVT